MISSIPEIMKAWVVREERHGHPLDAMLLEDIPTPTPGFGEVIIKVYAAGINYNHIWACRGIPVKISQLHPEDPMHIGGSDASGVVVAVGAGVTTWKPGDEVITQPNQSCGQCPECNGGEPLSCEYQKAWGFETSYGSFAQYAKVKAQQLLPKPERLSWEDASCHALKMFTAYRMLFVSCSVKPGDHVLIWGASGGLGSYAIQLCKSVNAIPICVVSSPEKEAYCRSFGAELFINRKDFPYLDNANQATTVPTMEMRLFRKSIRNLTGGKDPEIVFEHSGAATFPTSVYVAAKMGKIVICGATTGYQLSFDARYLWMHQKQIIGSHGCNLHDATRANELMNTGVIRPTLTQVFEFSEATQAHQNLMDGGTYSGSLAIRVANPGDVNDAA